MKILTSIILLYSSLMGVSEEYDKTKAEILLAVDARNFIEVKELLTDIMPLMKADLKTEKSELMEAKKITSKEEFSTLKEVFDQKFAIYKRMDHLLGVSPAAVRARSDQLILMLNRYEELSL